jgi:leader peptidase (prepilin peptidase)/N-methyltransferase
MAILFLICAQRTGWVPALFVRDWPFVFALVSLTAIDLEHRIIPDEISLGGLAYGLLTGWFFSPLSFAELVAGAGVGFGFFYLVAWAYQKYSGKEGLGGGDVKLIAMLGSFVGIYGVLWTILASSVLGSVAGVIVGALARKSKLLQTAIPYGPFLALGALVYYLFGLGTESWLPFTNLM